MAKSTLPRRANEPPGRAREAEETLRAIRAGEVDAIVTETPAGEQILTLKGAEHPYRVMLETINEGALAVAPDGVILYCNKRFAEMAKAPPRAIIGAGLAACFPGAERAGIAAALHDSLTGPSRLRAHLLAGGGPPVPVQIATRLAEAETPSIAVVVTDLSEVTAVETALRRSEERYRTLVMATTQLVWTTDGNGRVVEDLPLWRAFTGQSCEQVFGDRWSEALHPEDVDAAVAIWQRSVREHTPFSTKYRLRRRDGIYRRMSVHGVPVKEEDGDTREWIGTATDITERTEAEGKLRASEALFRGLVEQQIAGIYIVEADGTIAYVNPHFAEIFGYGTEEMLGHSMFEFIAEPDRGAVHDRFSAQFSGREPSSEITARLIAKNGALVDVLAHGTISTYRGRPASIGVVLDISERSRVRRHLEASEERFRLLVEEAPDPILLYDADQNRFLSANKAAERLFACGRDEIVRRGPLSFYPTDQPDGRAAAETFVEHIARALAGEETTFDRRIVNAAGEERLCQITLVRLPSETARLLRASHVDVTEQRRAERALAEQIAILATEHDLAPDGILVVDKAGKIVSANRRFAEIFDFPAELIASGEDAPVLAMAAGRMADREAFLERVQHLYDHPEESARDEVLLKDGRVVDRHTAPMRMDGGYFGRVWYFRDITERVEAERSLRRLNQALRTLSRGNEVVIRAADEGQLMREMCRAVVETSGYRMAWVGAVEHDAAKSVTPVAWAGEVGHYLEKARITWADTLRGRGPHGRAIRSGMPQITRDLAGDPSVAPWREEAKKCGFASSVVLPLKSGEPFAVLMIYAGEPDAFGADELRLLQELADDLAFGVRGLRERARGEAIEKRWRASLETTVGAIASTVEMRDPYTAGHQQRVASLAVAIARELNFPDQDCRGIYLAAVLHDVGKIRVPAEILSKPGRLSKVEFELIQGHAQAGYDVVKGIDFPWPIARTILQHHERLDGSGYPQGLEGDAILPEAKILAVADTVEAIVSHRPYRAGRGLDAALAEIEKSKGRLFDPAVVDACVALFRGNRFAFAGEAG